MVGDPVGRAILCIALNPQSGDFSGAILGVRSVALLHLGSSLVFNTEQIGKVQGDGILINVFFAQAQAVSLCDVVPPKGEVMAAELR